MNTTLAILISQLAAARAAGVQTINHLRVLLFIAGREDVTPTEIARSLDLQHCNVTGVMDSLDALGLAERVPVPGDRRKYHFTLTSAGFALVTRDIGEAVPAETADAAA